MSMFPTISRQIALRFTAFVFLLLLINGVIFLALDLENEQRMEHDRLMRQADVVARQAEIVLEGGVAALPRSLRESIRIVDGSGAPVHVGELFADAPFQPTEGFSSLDFENESYDVVTIALHDPNQTLEGYVQLAQLERVGPSDVPLRGLLYLLVSVIITVLTYQIGKRFARGSLVPAEQAMRQLEQFTQDASHELRTPLAALSSSLDLALKTGQYREGIESAKDDLHQASALLEKLLQMARLGHDGIGKTSVNLAQLVDQTVDRMRPLAAERRVELKTQTVDVLVIADDSLLRQVLQNLIGNAIKFSKPEGGTVTVTLKKDSLSVEDQGIGIAGKDVDHIFDRFYQADASRSKQGFGLGLALVKRIVDLHGWTITAKSTPSKGTTFTIRFGN